MYPNINFFGYVTIYFFWVFTLLGVICFVYLLSKKINRNRLDFSLILDKSYLYLLSMIFFSRVVNAIFNYTDYSFTLFSPDVTQGFLLGKPLIEIFYLFDTNYSIYGAMIGFLLIFLPTAYKRGEDIGKWLDTLIGPFLAALGIGSIGLFLEGSKHFGTPTSLPFGVIIETSKFTVPIHPTQLYTAIFCFVLAYLLHRLSKSPYKSFWQQNGNIFLFGIAIFSVFRFFEEFIIGVDKNLTIFNIYINYYLAFIFAALSITLLWKRHKLFKS